MEQKPIWSSIDRDAEEKIERLLSEKRDVRGDFTITVKHDLFPDGTDTETVEMRNSSLADAIRLLTHPYGLNSAETLYGLGNGGYLSIKEESDGSNIYEHEYRLSMDKGEDNGNHAFQE